MGIQVELFAYFIGHWCRQRDPTMAIILCLTSHGLSRAQCGFPLFLLHAEPLRIVASMAPGIRVEVPRIC